MYIVRITNGSKNLTKAKILDGGGHLKQNDYVFGFQINLEFGHLCFSSPLNYQKFTCVCNKHNKATKLPILPPRNSDGLFSGLTHMAESEQPNK